MDTPAPTEALVRRFWALMAGNDFDAVAAVLAHEFRLEWPQSNELIRSPARFAQMNREYPAHGPWQFQLLRLVAGNDEAVTQVIVSDGVQRAEVISFFSIDPAQGLITRLLEFWPEPYAAPASRAHLSEPLQPPAHAPAHAPVQAPVQAPAQASPQNPG